jgi:hypothetical protein
MDIDIQQSQPVIQGGKISLTITRGPDSHFGKLHGAILLE